MPPNFSHTKLAFRENFACVYKITFDDKWFYIGGTRNYRARISHWKVRIANGTPKNKNIKKILSSVKKVVMEVVEKVYDEREIKVREDLYIKSSLGQSGFLNRCPSAFSNLGIKLFPDEIIRNSTRLLTVNRVKINHTIRMGAIRIAQLDSEGVHIVTHLSKKGVTLFTGLSTLRINSLLNGTTPVYNDIALRVINKNGFLVPYRQKTKVMPNNKPVRQKEMNGTLIQIFPSLKLAAKYMNGNSNCLSRAIYRKNNVYKGFKWEYA